LRKAVPILPIFKKIIEGCCAASRRAVKLWFWPGLWLHSRIIAAEPILTIFFDFFSG
jgi:hypothetical protein